LVDTTYYDANLNVLVTKQFAFVAKYSNAGNQLWLKKYGNDEKDNTNAIALDANGDVYAIGNYKGQFSVGTTTLPNATSTSAFVAKLSSANGSTLFAYQHGVSMSEVEGWGISVNQQNGNVYTAGVYRGSCTFGPNTINPQGIWDIFVVLLNNSVAQGVADLNMSNPLTLFPNPSSDKVSIALASNLSLTNAKVSIYSMDARLVSSPKLYLSNLIDVSTLPAGNYVMQLSVEGSSFQKIFTKQ
jgi:hypothetical protein